jgi:hypothetical protein
MSEGCLAVTYILAHYGKELITFVKKYGLAPGIAQLTKYTQKSLIQLSTNSGKICQFLENILPQTREF